MTPTPTPTPGLPPAPQTAGPSVTATVTPPRTPTSPSTTTFPGTTTSPGTTTPPATTTTPSASTSPGTATFPGTRATPGTSASLSSTTSPGAAVSPGAVVQPQRPASVRPTAAGSAGAPVSGAAAQPRALPASAPQPAPPAPSARLRVGLVQLVCWEVALGVAAGLAGRSPATDVVAGLVVLGVIGVTATGWRGLWCFQWIRLALGYLLRGPRFVAVEAYRGRLELGDVDAGTIIRPDDVTVLLETDVPPDAAPGDLVEDRTDLCIKLIRRPGRAWIAITAVRSVDRRGNTELDLLLSNTVRRLTKRLHRQGLRAEPLGPSDLANLLTSLTPKQVSEEWDALDLGTGRYRMYAVPPHLALQQAGAVTVTTSSDLDHALVVAHADAPQGQDAVHQTGRQRAAFLAALP